MKETHVIDSLKVCTLEKENIYEIIHYNTWQSVTHALRRKKMAYHSGKSFFSLHQEKSKEAKVEAFSELKCKG